jgi:hypothetical protein
MKLLIMQFSSASYYLIPPGSNSQHPVLKPSVLVYAPVQNYRQNYNLEYFNLYILSKEQHETKISSRFTALEILNEDVAINRTWKIIGESIKIFSAKENPYYELKQHKPLFDEACSELLDQQKQAKLQWLQDPSQISGNKLNNVRREASRHNRNKKREYLKNKISLQYAIRT